MKRLFVWLWLMVALACSAVLGGVGFFQYTLPDQYTVTQGQPLYVGEWVQDDGDAVATVTSRVGDSYRRHLRLLGVFPVKEVSVTVAEPKSVVVCGMPFGIKLYTDGVLVVGQADVNTAAGNVNPAAAAGVCVGDTILSVNGEAVTTGRDVSRLINACGGKAVTLRLRRDGVEFNAVFTPVRPAGESGYRLGLWVRDSTAGVGTLTFYDPASGAFAGLGHAVCDVDTGKEMPLASGEIVPARVFGITKSVKGSPGELKGCFEEGTWGKLMYNGTQGLYGVLSEPLNGWKTVTVAPSTQVKTGFAQILTTLEGVCPQLYDISIEHLRSGASSNRHMVIKVTDPRLLELAGGIVQGMSGSPVIQNGKLVGAVTHVLVDDPTKGYAIFAETMLETAGQVADEKALKDAS